MEHQGTIKYGEDGYFSKKLYERELPYFYLEETDSTNEEAKRFFNQQKGEQALFIAGTQTAGKGRKGRKFYSPAEDGIYMSLLFTPKDALEEVIAVTTAASVVVARAIEEVTGQRTLIKWVNDLFLGERKVCGILAEAVMPAEPGNKMAVILGIGINVSTRSFPEELKTVAGSLMVEQTVLCKEKLICKITEGLLTFLEDVRDTSYLSEYRKRSMVLGKEIICYEGAECFFALALDVDDRGGLVIKTQSGEQKVLHSGEITIRLYENQKDRTEE